MHFTFKMSFSCVRAKSNVSSFVPSFEAIMLLCIKYATKWTEHTFAIKWTPCLVFSQQAYLIWRFDWSCSSVSVTVVLLSWRFDCPGSLRIFSIFCFLPIAILSRSSQTRFVCRYVLLSVNFLESFSIFSMDFFCLSKKVKEALLISGSAVNLFFLGPNR